MHHKNAFEMLRTFGQQKVLLAILVFTLLMIVLLVSNYQLMSTDHSAWRYAQLAGVALAICCVFGVCRCVLQYSRKEATLLDTQQQTHAILNSVNSGLFLINTEHTISHQHSKQLESILGTPNLANKNLLQVLSHLVLEQELNVIHGYVKQLFDADVSDKLLQELNPLNQIDVRITNQQGKRVSRCLDFQFTRIYENTKIATILVNVSDVTHAIQQQQQAVFRSDLQANLLLAIMNADRAAITSFLRKTQHQLDALHEILSQESGSTKSQKLKLEPLSQFIKQLRFDANQLNLLVIVYLSDEFEQHLSYLKHQHYLSHDDFLPLDITLDQLEHVLQTITQVHARLQLNESPANHVLAQQELDPEHMLQTWQTDAQILAKQHHKNIHLICTTASFHNLPAHLLHTVQQLTWHLISNAVVHGIENTDARVEKAKTEHGQITVSLLDLGNEYRLSVEDDGQGIDYELIEQKASALGWMDGESEPANHKNHLLSQVFKAEFSTHNTISTDAGDGMGLYWVKTHADELGAHIDVQSIPHQLTRFVVLIPKFKNEASPFKHITESDTVTALA